jgi:type I restriction enzyme R subunit
MRRASNQ